MQRSKETNSEIQKTDGKIGFFDSGIGGISILLETKKRLPSYDYIYLADSAYAPYGDMTESQIYDSLQKALDFLFQNDCSLVIIACNSASTEPLKKYQDKILPLKYPKKKVLGVIVPTVEYAIENTGNKNIGLLATHRTVQSNTYKEKFQKADPTITLTQVAAPTLVPLIESGRSESEEIQRELTTYLHKFKEANIDSLILGCTHYEILSSHIKEILGPEIKIITQGAVVAQKINTYLKNHPEVGRNLSQKEEIAYHTTGDTKPFKDLVAKTHNKKITTTKAHPL